MTDDRETMPLPGGKWKFQPSGSLYRLMRSGGFLAPRHWTEGQARDFIAAMNAPTPPAPTPEQVASFPCELDAQLQAARPSSGAGVDVAEVERLCRELLDGLSRGMHENSTWEIGGERAYLVEADIFDELMNAVQSLAAIRTIAAQTTARAVESTPRDGAVDQGVIGPGAVPAKWRALAKAADVPEGAEDEIEYFRKEDGTLIVGWLFSDALEARQRLNALVELAREVAAAPPSTGSAPDQAGRANDKLGMARSIGRRGWDLVLPGGKRIATEMQDVDAVFCGKWLKLVLTDEEKAHHAEIERDLEEAAEEHFRQQSTFQCPLCGKDTPHHHSAEEQAELRALEATPVARSGDEGRDDNPEVGA